ncbi:MAG: glutaredoxin domain-containing protein [Nitrospinota bacterium]|mgnify:CR=1 FL=1
MPYAIEMYTTNPCSFCLAAKNLLQKRGLEWREHLVFGGTPEWDAMIQRTGGKTVPQVIVNGEVVGGFPELAALDKEGRLHELANGG